MLMLATLAVACFCVALFLAIAPLFFVEGTLRPVGAYQREKVIMVARGLRKGASRRPAGKETAYDMLILDSNSTSVTTVVTTSPLADSAEAIYYLPVWPYVYVGQAKYNYGIFGGMALVFAVVGFACYLGASHFRKMTWRQGEEEIARKQEDGAS